MVRRASHSGLLDRSRLAPLGVAVALWALPHQASAQEVYIFGVDADEALTDLASEIERAIDDARGATRSPSLIVTYVPDATILDTSLLLGCSALTPECLTEMAATLEVDRLLYGSLVLDDQVPTLRLHSFDAQSQMIAAYAWDTRVGPLPEIVRADLPVFLDNRAILQVQSPSPGALTINGIPAGSAPHRIVGAELGIYDVEVETVDGEHLYGVAYCEQPNYCDTEVSADFVTPRETSDGWYWVAAGGASLIGAATFGILAAQNSQEAEYDEEGSRDQERHLANAERFRPASYLLLATGLAFSSYGGYRIYTTRRDQGPAITATINPLLGRDTRGLTLDLVF